MTWQVQTAKQRFSELVERAVNEGPQIVTKHGRETVVVLEIGEYRKLVGPPMDFKEFLLTMPRTDDLEIERSQDMGRDVEL
jgi:prevent-host-death family protein